MNNYHIYEEVGRGKYSVVYKGRIKKSIKYVAVKSVERSRRRKLMNEVRIFHDLNHKNVLKFYNWYETRNHLWIIFEYCPAGDLYQIIEQDKRLVEENVRKFAVELVEGLSYLHSNGIIYSDLKPSNILINEYGTLKYCDFGLSKKITDFANSSGSSGSGDTSAIGSDPSKPKAGTPYYMAPELFQDSGVHSFYSDFWSLGCVLYELATGKPPFCTNSLKDLITMIVEADFPRVDSFSPEFNDLLRKLLEKDPIKRINWEELKTHTFWTAATPSKPYEFIKRVYPLQTQFDTYLRQRGIVPEHFYDQRNNPLVKKLGVFQQPGPVGPGGSKVDILRLSHNVRRNMKREEDDENGNQYGPSTSANASSNPSSGGHLAQQVPIASIEERDQVDEDDIALNNRKMVLNFGEKAADEEETESTSASSGQGSSKNPSSGSQTPSNQSTALGGGAFLSQQQQLSEDIDINFNKLNEKQKLIMDQQPPAAMGQVKHNARGQQHHHQMMVMGAGGSDAAIFGDDSQQQPMMLFEKVNIQPMILQQQQQQPVQKKAPSSAMNPQRQQHLLQQQQLSGKSIGHISPNQTQSLIPQGQTNFTIGSVISTQQPQAKNQAQAQKDLLMMINQTDKFFTTSQQENTPPTVMLSAAQSTVQPQSSSNAAGQKADPNLAKVPHKSIEQLLMHNSDTAVKPIIGNKEIEKQVDPTFDASQLSFQPWSPDQVLQKIETPQIEAHLNDLYNAIASGSMNEKVNALLYFESIVINSNVSNRLINSAFMNLLVKMMKTLKTPQIKIRLCSVIGLLIRHSTVIENEVAESEVCLQLIEALRDKNERVRRKAIAALGEYLFYAATQLDDEQADACWQIKDEAIAAVIRSLRDGEDETVRFYASKTLENISAQSNSAGERFATVDAVNNLLQIFLTPPTPQQQQPSQQMPIGGGTINENLRTSAAVALSHVCRLNPTHFPMIFNKITCKMFCYTLIEGQSRVQQAFITMLNQAMVSNVYPKLQERLLNEESFLKSLMRLLEHHSIVIRGKVLLTFLLLFRANFRWLALVDPEVKFFHVLDRLSRDNYKYVQCCLVCLADGIVDLIPSVFQAISEELNVLLNGGRTATIPSEFDKKINRSEFESLQGNLIYVAIILDLLNSQSVKVRIVNPAFVRSVATLLDNCDVYSFQEGAEEFLNALLLIVENMSSNQKILLSMNESIMNLMMPVLLSKTKSESADIRFLSLKIFTDILIQYLNDDSIYDLQMALSDNFTQAMQQDMMPGQGQLAGTTRAITDLVQNQLFPCFLPILQDNDPVPLFGLKLLSAIVERNPGFVRQMRRFNLFYLVVENYQVNHPRLNRHTMNILKSIVESKELSFQELQQYRVVERSHAILKSMVANKQDWCTEILLDIVQLVLAQFNEAVKTREAEIARLIEEVFANFDVCVQLLAAQQETAIMEKASQCLILMLQLYALCQQKKREIYFVENHMQYLVQALRCEKKIIQKRVLKCIYWALIQTEYTIKLKADRRQGLEQQIQMLLGSEDRSIANTSREIYKILQEQGMGSGGGMPMMMMGSAGAGSMESGSSLGMMNQQQQMNFYMRQQQQQ